MSKLQLKDTKANHSVDQIVLLPGGRLMMFGILHMTRSRGCRGRGREREAVGCGMEWNGRHRPLAASIGVLALSHTVQSHEGERRVGHDAHLPLSPPLPSARNGFPIPPSLPCSPARNRAGSAWKQARGQGGRRH